jgi:hypothetical protein
MFFKDFHLINTKKRRQILMRKLRLGFITAFLVVCMLLTFSGAASASEWPGPKIYADDWPERGWC